MFKCVDCGYQGFEFHAGIAGRDQGAFTYAAECPKCGSRKVKHLPGYHERDLRIRIKERDPAYSRAFSEDGKSYRRHSVN
jgi:hypothetical protein